jgi:hypothetical protein
LEILVAALTGSFAEVMRKLVGLVVAGEAKFPVATDLIEHLYQQLVTEVGDKLTPDQLRASITEVVAILSGKSFGPPNPGAVALQ